MKFFEFESPGFGQSLMFKKKLKQKGNLTKIQPRNFPQDFFSSNNIKKP